MTKFYYYESSDEPMTAAHDSGELASVETLNSLGVFYERMPELDQVNALAEARSYKNRDQIKLTAETPGLQQKLDIFFAEHLHDDEEIRYITAGQGYFDVRDLQDRWIRCDVGPGDMLILPAGIWHRFTLTDKLYVEAIRLFKDEPKWIAIDRTEEGENLPSRVEYLSAVH